ncbi:MAG: hypothetical protein ACXWUG_23530 [Polyangiales bacterium]
MDASPPPQEPPGIFARATDDNPLDRQTFLVPGVTFIGWQPLEVEEPVRVPKSGFGAEVSVVHWIGSGTYLGGVVRAERLDRTRAALGFEFGYQLIGLELAIARDFAAKDGPSAQWSLEVAPYASLGVLYLSPRWIVALDHKDGSPGSGAAFVVGLKIPLRIAGPVR